VDYVTGDLWLTKVETGESHIVANFPEPLDNLAITDRGTIYLASLADSGIIEFDPATGESKIITVGPFTVPLGLTMTTFQGKESVIATDPFGYRFIDPQSGEITREPEMWRYGSSSAVAANDKHIVTTYADFGAIRKIDRETNEVLVTSLALKTPRGVALTSTGQVIIADADGDRLVRLAGEDVEQLAGGLREPVALLLENDSSALVTEVESGTISRVDLDTGQRTELVAGLHDPRAMARLPDGRIVVVEPGGGRVVAIDLASGERKDIASGLAVSTDTFHLPENTPLGIAVGKDGAIYVSCPGDNSIVKLTMM
jgi:DNA-binding beta-propeller fold protein YncE